MAKKYVYIYRFGGKKADGSAKMKDILGGKGANLAEMTNIGLPVPPGFTITAKLCMEYLKKKRFPAQLKKEVKEGIEYIEKITGKKFGDRKNPLLVSVRSGARVSMPGMMDTILNLGLNDEAVEGLAEVTQNRRFALDSYRRLIEMFSDVVMGIPRKEFEDVFEDIKKKYKVNYDYQVPEEGLEEVIERYKKIYKKHIGEDFPQNPKDQLWKAIGAVYNSWNNPRAIEYRKIYNIPDTWGTAVNIQAMVFGNMGEDSATGVAFTRNPSTGEKKRYGEYLPNAQGEDVVAGVRTPKPLEELKKEMPKVYRELENIFKKLESHYRDMQDVEFTIEKGKLWILQTRTGKRTALAAVKIAVDMAKEGLITKEEAIMRVTPEQVDQLLHPMIDPNAKYTSITKGLPASPGAATGEVVFFAEDAVKRTEEGKNVILVRHQTSADDVAGMAKAEGFLTATGGMTSHAAVVARGMGKPCVVGAEEIEIDYDKKEFRVKDKVIKEGEVITIDGSTGDVIVGAVPTIQPRITRELNTLLKWADQIRKLGVRTNADLPKDAEIAREYGAEGIGLCRTEHMFFGKDRIGAMREMILADTEEERRKALEKLLPMQKKDFIGLFKVMHGLPVIIRTLDPPLHEFLPHDEEAMQEVANEMGVSVEKIRDAVKKLQEANPMLGHRGVRLGITYPEIIEMQARAILEAACEVKKEGKKVIPEIMIPVVTHVKEIERQKEIIDKVAKEVFKKYGFKIKYMVGTMIEIPRAALTADEIARVAEFFSYGTNDLTQTTFGFSRDDIAKFLPEYIEKGILENDPFQTLDQKGVGELVKIGLERGRKTNPKLEIGICGEHGGDPKSIEFCHKIGLDYVSCSPYRVPIARLAAAQAAIKEVKKGGRKRVVQHKKKKKG